jgi:Pectate lyase superfamily protein/Carbohydrate binding module (family 6)/Carbohydrate binding module (family 35)
VVTAVAAPPANQYEAESAALSGGAAVESDHTGYTGSGFVGGFTDGNAGNAQALFTVSASAAGSATVALRYSNGNGATKTISLYLNGTKLKQISLVATADWNTWTTETETVTLNKGSNTIAYKYDSGDTANVNLDNIVITGVTTSPTATPTPTPTSTPTSPAGQYEAEAAALAGGAVTGTDHTGYTGTGFVEGYTDTNKGNANTTFTVSSSIAGTANVSLRYSNGNGVVMTLSLYVNGTKLKQISLAATADWNTWTTETENISLNKGSNTISYKFDTTDSGNVNLDNIVMGTTASPSPTPTPTPTPSTSPTTPPTGSNTYEAETSFISGGPSVATATSGYTGTGYLTGFTATGARTIITANVPSSGNYAVILRYANTTGASKTISMYVNGLKSSQLTLAAGSGWLTTTQTVALRSKVNLIGYQIDSGDTGAVFLDNITVTGGVAMAANGATLPYTEYLATAGSTNGSLVAASRTYGTVASEAVGRQYVSLTATGQYVQWTTTAATNSIDVRFNIPDSTDGTGITAPLALYANGTKVQDLTLTSTYEWTYGAYPYDNTPSDGSPHHFFDEVHALIGSWPTGTVLKLQKDSTDTAAYYNINLIDTEQVDAAYTMPANYISIATNGATANDGTDDTNAINTTISQAESQGKGVWFPAGTFNVNSEIQNVANVSIRGAGMWYTTMQGVNGLGGFNTSGNNVTVADMSINNAATYRNDGGTNPGIEGNFGTGSLVYDVWMEHDKVGMWPNSGTNGLYVEGVRIRDMWADGINLHANVFNTTVDNAAIRNTGDDGMAMFSDGTAVTNSTFTRNTVQDPMLSNGIGIYGGSGDTASNNNVSDIVVNGSGITVSTYFGIPFSGPILVTGNVLNRAGSYHKDWATDIGAIWIFADNYDITNAVTVSYNTINNSTYQGIELSYNHQVSNLLLDHDTISAPGTYGIDIYDVTGSLTANYVTVTGAGTGGLNDINGYTINRGAGDTGF